MSSAISTKPTPKTDADDAGFKPWHFFVLASLAAATVAVVMSRQATPEHLILISATIGAAGVAAAAVYRMLAPLTVDDAALVNQRQSERARNAVEREKALVLRSIKELEFDRAMGKVSPRDFDEMAGRLRARAMMLIKQADEGGAGYRELIERELSARLAARGRTTVMPQAPVEVPAVPQSDLADAAVPRTSEASQADEATGGRVCADCGTGNDVDAAFCKRCGSRLEAVIA
jgi:ribosomal protein L40E